MCAPATTSPEHEPESSSNATTTTRRKPLNKCWTYLMEDILHKSMRRFVVALATHAARYPMTYIATITFFSMALIAIGFFTNFRIIYSHEEIFTPFGSLPELHSQWIEKESGFANTRPFMIVLHRNGDSVLQASSLEVLFETLTTVQETPGYESTCQQSSYLDRSNQPTCRMSSATQFWNHNSQVFLNELNLLETVQEQDEHVIRILSNDTFPDDTPVFHEAILGNYQMDTSNNNTQILTTAQSLILSIDLPDFGKASDELEERILERMKDKRQQDNNGMVVEYFTMYSYLMEFERAVYSDIPLVVVMMFTMVAFCCLVFYNRKDPIQSRALTGVFSIATIGMSLMTGYGIVWCLGVPFTNIAMMVPFVVVGVGLDDTFIITGAYFRKSMQQSRQPQGANDDAATRDQRIIARVQETMEEVGLSISLTTTTTCLAFLLGSISSIPAIRWLCIYGFACISVDFIYQCSYFVAWMVLDERRVQAKRKDICIWISLAEEQEEAAEEEDEVNHDDDANDNRQPQSTDNSNIATSTDNDDKNFSERFMSWYADKLLHPVSKVFVLVFFAVYLAGCVYSATLLTQEFKVENYVPKDSHVKTFFVNFEEYSTLFRSIGVYFRNVNQSDPVVQQQMLDYVDELSQMEQIGAPPQFFWVRDFAEMAEAPEFQEQSAALGLKDASFEEQIDLVLSIPEVRDVYGYDIVRDSETGEITASRCYLHLRNIDMNSIPNQVDLLMDQRAITKAQPINQGKNEFSFFTFDDLYFFFELYSVSVDELIFTTISGVAAVSFVAFILIPHWSSILFVMPLIIALYFMLLGTMQYSGIHINAVTYVIIVMAIGLLVDFLMHILLRYYETTGKTRHEKVKETLETMGASILLGGLTTFLGVIPLAFSTTTIFMVVFKSFLAMVSLGCGVGLTLLPVLLSLVGPVVCPQEPCAIAAAADGGQKSFIKENSSTAAASSGDSFQSSEKASVDSAIHEVSSDETTDQFLHVVKSSSQGGGYEIDV